MKHKNLTFTPKKTDKKDTKHKKNINPKLKL